MSALFNSKDINIEKLLEEIKASSDTTAIYVGADSKQFKKNNVKFVAYVTVVVLHKDGNKGATIHKQYSFEKDFGSLRQRLMKEVELAIEVGYKIADSVGGRPFQIHLDLNPDPKHKSSICVKEATGWVIGYVGYYA